MVHMAIAEVQNALQRLWNVNFAQTILVALSFTILLTNSPQRLYDTSSIGQNL